MRSTPQRLSEFCFLPVIRTCLRSHDDMMSSKHGIFSHNVSFTASKTCAAHHKSFPKPSLLPVAQTRLLVQPHKSDNAYLSPRCFVSTPSVAHSTQCSSVSFQLLLPLTQRSAVSNARAVLRMSIRTAKSLCSFLSFFHIHQQAKTDKPYFTHTLILTSLHIHQSHPHQYPHTARVSAPPPPNPSSATTSY